EAIKTHDATLSANRYVAIAAQGGVAMQGGTVYAGDSFGTSAASLSDSATVNGAISDNNKRYAVKTISINTAGDTAIEGTSYNAGKDLIMDTGALSVGADGATIAA